MDIFLIFLLLCITLVTLYFIKQYYAKPNWNKLFSHIEDPEGMVIALTTHTIIDSNSCLVCPRCGGEAVVEISGYLLSHDTSTYEDGSYIDSRNEAIIGYVGSAQVECEDCRHTWTVNCNEHSVQGY